jgi:hypothetical protein
MVLMKPRSALPVLFGPIVLVGHSHNERHGIWGGVSTRGHQRRTQRRLLFDAEAEAVVPEPYARPRGAEQ